METKVNPRDLAKPVIERIKKAPQPIAVEEIHGIYRSVVDFWDAVGQSHLDSDGEVDRDSVHYQVAYTLVSSLTHVGFDPETEEGQEYLDTAAEDLVQFLDSEEASDTLSYEPEVLGRGKNAMLEDGTTLAVDLIGARVVANEPVCEPIRRTEPKIGRNQPCPCGNGRKWKKCGLLNLCPPGSDQ